MNCYRAGVTVRLRRLLRRTYGPFALHASAACFDSRTVDARVMPAVIAKGAAFRASNTSQSQINRKPCAACGHTLQNENGRRGELTFAADA